jgi:RNA polymerase sigma-70 factor (ECF subfamily)
MPTLAPRFGIRPPSSSDDGSTAASDVAVLAGYGASEPVATAEFVRRFQRRVYGLAVAVVADPRVAEDVAQEALLRAWRHADDFDALRGTVASWLLTITRNLAVDAVRRRRPPTIAPGDLAEMSVPAAERRPDDLAVLSDELVRMRAALMTLPEEQRRAVVLAKVWGCTSRQIAVVESVPLGTVKTRIRLALERLRGALVDDGEPSS